MAQMTAVLYGEVANKAHSCGVAKYTLQKTQNVLYEQYGKNLDPPATYKGATLLDAYFEGYQK